MTSIDVAILVVLGLSIAIAAWRGLVRSVLSLVGWIAALVLAALFGTNAAMAFPAHWSEGARVLGGHVVVFVVVLIVMAIVARVASKFVNAIGLGGLDRLLGALFGLVRGALIVAAVVFVASWTPVTLHPAWRASVLLPYIGAALEAVLPTPGGTRRVIEI